MPMRGTPFPFEWLTVTSSGARDLAQGERIVGTPAQLATALPFLHAVPLLEEERDAGALALVADREDPLLVHGSGPVPALAADDHPVNPGEIECSEIFEQRLHGE